MTIDELKTALQALSCYKERGNRDDYLYSDCGKDADCDSISAGILDIVRLDKNEVVYSWGWYKSFSNGSGDVAIAEDIVQDCEIAGMWDCSGGDGDEASWTVLGDDEETLTIEASKNAVEAILEHFEGVRHRWDSEYKRVEESLEDNLSLVDRRKKKLKKVLEKIGK